MDCSTFLTESHPQEPLAPASERQLIGIKNQMAPEPGDAWYQFD
jgi:hypothetical protein